jgi:hypothetical protein
VAVVGATSCSHEEEEEEEEAHHPWMTVVDDRRAPIQDAGTEPLIIFGESSRRVVPDTSDYRRWIRALA